MTRTSVFIALDGVDGAGNSTHSRLLAKWIHETFGLEVMLTKEPTGKPVGRLIRRYLRAPKGSTPSATDALLFAADRIEHTEKVLKPALESGVVVVSDRYLESSIAYQSAQGLPLDWLLSINRYAMKPSLNIILDISPERSLARKTQLLDKFEEVVFLRNVRRVFLDRAKAGDYPIVDTSGSVDETQNKIRNIVGSFLRRCVPK
nr:dTMP kinase [Candidatus Njordarchaeum guaymaensis]